jgi:hypothetical protein
MISISLSPAAVAELQAAVDELSTAIAPIEAEIASMQNMLGLPDGYLNFIVDQREQRAALFSLRIPQNSAGGKFLRELSVNFKFQAALRAAYRKARKEAKAEGFAPSAKHPEVVRLREKLNQKERDARDIIAHMKFEYRRYNRLYSKLNPLSELRADIRSVLEAAGVSNA